MRSRPRPVVRRYGFDVSISCLPGKYLARVEISRREVNGGWDGVLSTSISLREENEMDWASVAEAVTHFLADSIRDARDDFYAARRPQLGDGLEAGEDA